MILDPTSLDYQNDIGTCLKAGAKVFVFFLDPSTAARFLEQGHNLGLFGQNTIVFVNSDVSQGDPAQYLSPGADPTQIFRGVFGLRRDPNFVVRNFPIGTTLVQGLRGFNSTLSHLNGTLACNNATDDDGHYLFINATGGCEPFSFLSLTVDNVSPKAIAAFDGVLMYAAGANFTSATFTHTALGRIALHDALVSTNFYVSIFGASGIVIFNVRSKVTYYCRRRLTFYCPSPANTLRPPVPFTTSSSPGETEPLGQHTT